MADDFNDLPIKFKKLNIHFHKEFKDLLNDREFTHFLKSPYPVTKDWVRNYIDDSMKQFDKSLKFTWGVFKKVSNFFMGVAVIKNIDYINKVAEVGYCLEKSYDEKGYTEMTLHLLIKIAFEKLKINRIELRVDRESYKTLNFLNQIGLEQEGLLRQAHYYNNRFHDIYLYSIIHDDFLKWKINKSIYAEQT